MVFPVEKKSWQALLSLGGSMSITAIGTLFENKKLLALSILSYSKISQYCCKRFLSVVIKSDFKPKSTRGGLFVFSISFTDAKEMLPVAALSRYGGTVAERYFPGKQRPLCRRDQTADVRIAVHAGISGGDWEGVLIGWGYCWNLLENINRNSVCKAETQQPKARHTRRPGFRLCKRFSSCVYRGWGLRTLQEN